MTGPRSYLVNDGLEEQLGLELLCICTREPYGGGQAKNWAAELSVCWEDQWDGRDTQLRAQEAKEMSGFLACLSKPSKETGSSPSQDLLPHNTRSKLPQQSCPMKDPAF